MNRLKRNGLYPILLLAGLGIVLQFSGILSLRRVCDNSLLPAHRKGTLVWTSCLKSYSYGDKVYFSSGAADHAVQMLRIAGLEGDTIEIHDGYLLRNGYIADRPEQLMFAYYVRKKFLTDTLFYRYLTVRPESRNDTVHFALTFAECALLGRSYLLHKDTQAAERVAGKKPFGPDIRTIPPVVVPRGMCFVLSDNRDNGSDSRAWGFLPLASVKATLLSHR